MKKKCMWLNNFKSSSWKVFKFSEKLKLVVKRSKTRYFVEISIFTQPHTTNICWNYRYFQNLYFQFLVGMRGHSGCGGEQKSKFQQNISFLSVSQLFSPFLKIWRLFMKNSWSYWVTYIFFSFSGLFLEDLGWVIWTLTNIITLSRQRGWR